MPQEINYAPTVRDLVLQYMKATDATNPFNSYFYGIPSQGIPIEMLPAFCVGQAKTRIEQDATNTDLITYDLTVLVIVNQKDFTDEFDDQTVAWDKKLELIVEGRDPTTGYYDTNSIIGILRNQLTLGNFLIENEPEINYGEIPPKLGMSEDDWLGGANIKLTVQHRQTRLGSV